MANKLFLDTSYAVAVAVQRDKHRERALQWADRMERENRQLVTTQAVILEVGNRLAKPRNRPVACAFIEQIGADPNVDIVPVTDDLLARGFQLYKDRQDKSWGLVDCLSFVVMRDRDVHDALTTDRDFEQAGFNALLRE